jgi:hypothetical protein
MLASQRDGSGIGWFCEFTSKGEGLDKGSSLVLTHFPT